MEPAEHPSKPPDPGGDVSFVPDTGDSEIDELIPVPFNLKGDFDFEPRSQSAYPESPDELVELLAGSQYKDVDDETETLREEFMLQRLQATGDHVPEIPPKPLTVSELESIIEQFDRWDRDDVEVWVPCEYESVNRLAVGEYREYVEGYILRFQIVRNEQVWEYALVPDYSPTGFSWYTEGTSGVITTGGKLDASQSRRLRGLLDLSNPEEILNPPDRILYASQLLATPLVKGDMSPTPEGWVTTACSMALEESDLFFPRYKGTFVYKPTDTVVEVTPLPADAPDDVYRKFLEGDDGPSIEPPGMPSSAGTTGIEPQGDSDTEMEDEEPGHRWTLHFASDDVQDTIENEFSREVQGRELKHLLRKLGHLLGDTTD